MNSYTETFSIPSHLIGLALGNKGENIKRARTLKGIKNILFNQKDDTFTITGYNEELVKIVRHLLEYNEREISIDRALGELLKHDNGTLMQAMIYKSGLVRAELYDEDVDKPPEKQIEFIKLKFVGTVTSIDEAKSCIRVLKSSSEYSDFLATKQNEKKPQARFTEQFKVTGHLVGLAIGKNGCKIERARKFPSIVKIEQDDGDGFATFKIYSNSYQSLNEAREILEVAEDKTYIPKEKAGLVIGSKGSTINDIKNKTKVYRIDVKENEPNAIGHIPVMIIGFPSHIEAAKICIENKVR